MKNSYLIDGSCIFLPICIAQLNLLTMSCDRTLSFENLILQSLLHLSVNYDSCNINKDQKHLREQENCFHYMVLFIWNAICMKTADTDVIMQKPTSEEEEDHWCWYLCWEEKEMYWDGRKDIPLRPCLLRCASASAVLQQAFLKDKTCPKLQHKRPSRLCLLRCQCNSTLSHT